MYGLCVYILISALLGVQLIKGRQGFLDTLAYLLGGVGATISLTLTPYSIGVVRQACTWCLSSAVIMCLLLSCLARYHYLSATSNEQTGRTISRTDRRGSLFAVVTLPVILIGALAWQAFTLPQSVDRGVDRVVLANLPLSDLVTIDSRRFGNDAAPYTLIVFSDFGCSACHYYWPRVVRVAEETGNLAVVLRHLPLRLNSPAFSAAVAAESACSDAEFWQFLGTASQHNLHSSEQFEHALKSICGDDNERVAQVESRKRVNRDRFLAATLKVPGTPWMILIGPNDSFRRELSMDQLVELLGDRPNASRTRETM